MATIQTNLVCDSSTVANYRSWASAISFALQQFGWIQTNDTGQVMWTTLSISAVSMSGTTATYTYSGLSGLALAVGRTLVITGMTNAANNGTFVITASTGTTFTVTNASGVTEAGSTGAVTMVAAAPGTNVYNYEIWVPNDGLQNFYLKMEYGSNAGTNSPSIRATISTATNGAGVASGVIMGPQNTCTGAYTAPSTTVTYDCRFSGGPGRFNMLMWRVGGTNSNCALGVERSLNSSGTYTGTYVTLASCVNNQFTSNGRQPYNQQTLHFVAGLAPAASVNTSASNYGMPALLFCPGTSNSGSFNGSLPFSPAFPMIGYYDYPMTMFGAGNNGNYLEAQVFTTTLYGTTRSYIATYGTMQFSGPATQVQAFCMRYD